MTSVTAWNTFAICWNTPSKTGARRLQKPFQIALSVFVMSVMLIPREANRSFTSSTKPVKMPLICVQIAVIAFRKPSFVSHRCLNAATRTATTATIARIGAAAANMDPLSAPVAPEAAERAPESLPIPAVIAPIVETALPTRTRTGPIAAAIAAIFMIICCCSGVISWNRAFKSLSFWTTLSRTGAIMVWSVVKS